MRETTASAEPFKTPAAFTVTYRSSRIAENAGQVPDRGDSQPSASCAGWPMPRPRSRPIQAPSSSERSEYGSDAVPDANWIKTVQPHRIADRDRKDHRRPSGSVERQAYGKPGTRRVDSTARLDRTSVGRDNCAADPQAQAEALGARREEAVEQPADAVV